MRPFCVITFLFLPPTPLGQSGQKTNTSTFILNLGGEVLVSVRLLITQTFHYQLHACFCVDFEDTEIGLEHNPQSIFRTSTSRHEGQTNFLLIVFDYNRFSL